MSRRPVTAKKVARLRKLMRADLPSFIDPVDYVVSRGFAPTKRAARELIFDGRLRSESHKVGFDTIELRDDSGVVTKQKIIVSVPANLRGSLAVV